jgi:anthraniloyl-CoA monooxygenase
MRIAVIGGGPAGLYFAILMKRDFPPRPHHGGRAQPPDDTFGFGVVFSDADARHLPGRGRALLSRDHRELRLLGRHRDPRDAARAPHRRQRLLRLLAPHAAAAAAGPRARARRRAGIPPRGDARGLPGRRPDRRGRRHQLADPRALARPFPPEVDLRPNRFAWMGSTRPFDAFTFFFRERPEGIFIAHCYQYEAGASTWVLETDPETFARAGLEPWTRPRARASWKASSPRTCRATG